MKQKIDVVFWRSAQHGAKDTLEKKLVLLDKGLANLDELRRLKLRRQNHFTIVPVSHCSHAVESSHSAKLGNFWNRIKWRKVENSQECKGNGQNEHGK